MPAGIEAPPPYEQWLVAVMSQFEERFGMERAVECAEAYYHKKYLAPIEAYNLGFAAAQAEVVARGGLLHGVGPAPEAAAFPPSPPAALPSPAVQLDDQLLHALPHAASSAAAPALPPGNWSSGSRRPVEPAGPPTRLHGDGGYVGAPLLVAGGPLLAPGGVPDGWLPQQATAPAAWHGGSASANAAWQDASSDANAAWQDAPPDATWQDAPADPTWQDDPADAAWKEAGAAWKEPDAAWNEADDDWHEGWKSSTSSWRKDDAQSQGSRRQRSERSDQREHKRHKIVHRDDPDYVKHCSAKATEWYTAKNRTGWLNKITPLIYHMLKDHDKDWEVAVNIAKVYSEDSKVENLIHLYGRHLKD